MKKQPVYFSDVELMVIIKALDASLKPGSKDREHISLARRKIAIEIINRIELLKEKQGEVKCDLEKILKNS